MKKDSIKKYVLPNLPYLFIGWAFLKLGTAYRMAADGARLAGADFGAKLLGTLQTIGPAFADLAPGLNPFDWLIGLVGAVLFRLFIYQKVKKRPRSTAVTRNTARPAGERPRTSSRSPTRFSKTT